MRKTEEYLDFKGTSNEGGALTIYFFIGLQDCGWGAISTPHPIIRPCIVSFHFYLTYTLKKKNQNNFIELF